MLPTSGIEVFLALGLSVGLGLNLVLLLVGVGIVRLMPLAPTGWRNR